jgi:hypothetical protein
LSGVFLRLKRFEVREPFFDSRYLLCLLARRRDRLMKKGCGQKQTN